jgi:polysaccharide chain length determinant protein (PEP-CTERM system associated)
MLPGRKYTPLDIALMAWRRSWLIAGGLVLGVYGALVVSSLLRDTFQSEMLIQVIPQRVPDSYVQSTVTMRTEDRLNALSQQVLSRTALESLINEMNLYAAQRARLPMEDVVELMRQDVSVAPVASTVRSSPDAAAFYVRFTYTDREMSTRVTERLGKLFIDLNAMDRGQLAQATNDFLESQLTGTRQELEAVEKELEAFRQRNSGRLPTQLESNMQAIQSTQLNIQAQVESIARDRDRKMMLERLFHDAESEPVIAPATPPPVATDKPADGSAPGGLSPAQQLVVAQDALARLLLRLKPEHPDVARAKRIIADLEVRVAEQASVEGSAGVSVAPQLPLSPEAASRRERSRQMRAEIDSLDRQIAFKETEEKRLRETLAEFRQRIEEIPGVESEWIALTRDYKTQQAAYENLLAKSEQSKVAVELERRQIGEQFRVLDPARPPVRPTGIKRIQVNVAGAAVGLMLGVGLAALLEFRDRTFHTAQDLLEVLQLPIVAHVPLVMLDADLRRRRLLRRLTVVSVFVIGAVGAYGFWALRLWKFVV